MALMPVLAWLQYEWTGIASEANERRMRDNLRSTAFRIGADLEQELSIPRELLLSSINAGDSAGPDLQSALENVARVWKDNSRSSKVPLTIWLSVQDSWGGTATIRTDSLEPGTWTQSDPPPETGPGLFKSALVLSETPRLSVVMELNQKAVIENLLPTLAQDYFGPGSGLSAYAMTIKTPEGTTLFSTHPELAKIKKKPDVKLPILGHREGLVISRDEDRFRDNPAVRSWLDRRDIRLAPPPGTWVLELSHLDGSLEAAASKVRWLNLAGSLSLLLVLAGGLGYLYRLYRRNRLLVRSQKDFVASVSHELRTPLSVLRAATENMSEGLVKEPAQAIRYGSSMLGEANRLLALTENVIAWAGLEGSTSFSGSTLDLRLLVESTHAQWLPAFQEANASLILERQEQPLVINGDAESLRRALDNLLANALRHGLPYDGPRSVTLTLSSLDRLPGRRYKKSFPRGLVILEVSDHGPGIKPGEQKHIFEAFYRPKGSKGGGIGLGLSLVRRIVAAHQGVVELDSSPGNGSTFRIMLPREQNS